MCPGRRVGTKICVMYTSNACRSIAPSNVHGARKPSHVKAAMPVVFFLRRRGTASVARWSCGAQPYTRVRVVCVPLSSMKTNRSTAWGTTVAR